MDLILYNHKNGKNLEEQLREFARHASANCHATILEKADGSPQLIKKMYRPCYGESRAYGANSTRPEDDKPSDLPSPLPAGLRRIAYAAGIQRVSADKDKHNEFVTWLYKGEDSFFRNVGKYLEFEYSSDGAISGVIALDTSYDPTPLLSSLIYLRSKLLDRSTYDYNPPASKFYEAQGIVLSRLESLILENMICFPHPGYEIDEEATEVLAKQVIKRMGKPREQIPDWCLTKAYKKDPNNPNKYISKPHTDFQFIVMDRYHFTNNPDFKRIREANPHDLSSGKTFLDADDYNRPGVPLIFKDNEKNHFEEIVRKYALRVDNKTKYSPLEGLPKVVEYVREQLAA